LEERDLGPPSTPTCTVSHLKLNPPPPGYRILT